MVVTTAVAILMAAAVALTGLVGSPALAQDAEGESSRVVADEAVATDQAVVGDGHVDIGPRFLDGEWTLLVRDDTVVPSVWRRLPDIVLQATDAAVVEVPDDPQFAFLGEPGAEVWLLPQVQQPGILWPGWNTQDPEVATSVEREVTWALHDVEGPGDVVLFVNQDFGAPESLFDSREPFPQETGIEANTHAHANWVFTAPGVYRIAMEMSATTEDGDEVRGGGTLRIAVGDATDPAEGFAAPDLALPADDPGSDADAGADAQTGDGGDGAGSSAGADRDPRAGDATHDQADGTPTATAGSEDSGSAVVWLVAGGVVVLLVGVAAIVAARARARRRAGSPKSEAVGEAAGADAAGGVGAAGGQKVTADGPVEDADEPTVREGDGS